MKKTIPLVLLLLLSFSTLNAEEENLAKQSQNPVGNMYSVPMEYWHHDGSDGDVNANVFFIKPVIPVAIGEVNLINRFIIPYVGVDPTGGTDLGDVNIGPSSNRQTGLGNIQYQGIFSPAAPSSVIWGLGGIFEFPTHADNLGTDKYSAGPVFLALSMPGNWVFGTLIQNTWSFAGSGDDKVNKLMWQYFVNYNFSNGWYATTTPVMTADWEKASGEQWTVPIGGGVGKLMKFESFPPLDFKLQFFSNVIKPNGSSDYQAMFSVKLILPKALFDGSMKR